MVETLEGKVAIVTGASSGIGRATAHLFAAHGAALVLNARRSARLDEVAAEIRKQGGRVHVVVGDVRHAQTHATMVEVALHEFGGLDIAVNNAGTAGALKPLAEVSEAQW